MVKVKICGITNIEDANAAVSAGADALGFVFYAKSKRYIDPTKAKNIISTLPPFITTVGVFVNHSRDEVMEIREDSNIDYCQLHGDETPEYCSALPLKLIKAVRIKEGMDSSVLKEYPVSAMLFDTFSPSEYGGTGKTFNWDIVGNLGYERPIILAGGLDSSNVASAIGLVKPYAVDVSSAVEIEPGIKNHDKIKNFIKAAKYEN